MVRVVATACQLLALAVALTNAPVEVRAAEHDVFAAAETVRTFSFESDEDRDYDDLPDDWTRRRGPGFPEFVKGEIDRTRGFGGRASLRFDVDGGEAIFYSPPIPVDALHTFLFEGRARTQLLVHDAAIVTVSLLDHARRRVQRFESHSVTGTHDGFVAVRIGPMTPRPDVRFAVIGCHLVQQHRSGSEPDRDYRGAIWFDDLSLRRAPRLSLESNFLARFVEPSAPLTLQASVGGIDDEAEHRMVFELLDARDRVVATYEHSIGPAMDAAPGEAESGESPHRFGGTDSYSNEFDEAEPRRPTLVEWTLPLPENGFYRVRAELRRGDEPLLSESTTLAILDVVPPVERGEFGWSLPAEATSRLDTERFAEVVAQSGVHWLKQPLWRLASDGDLEETFRTVRFFDTLRRRNVQVVGVLESPPADVRRQFPDEWTGTSEVFALPREFWAASLEPVLAHFSSYVGRWQLGGDGDTSFVGLSRLDETLSIVREEFDRVGRNSRVGVRWTWDADLPALTESRGAFLSLLERDTLAPESFAARLAGARSAGLERWAMLKPLGRSSASLDERTTDLVKRMTLARVAGAEAIFATDVFDPEHGLLHADGSPTPLFLPWRTFATSLAGAEYLGRFQLPGGSTNHVFARDGEAIVVLWNDGLEVGEEPVVEEFFLGDDAYTLDPWGVSTAVPSDPETGRQSFAAGPMPLLLRGGVEDLARWRMAVRFRTGAFESATGLQPEAVLGRNTFPQGVNGRAKLVLDHDWQAEPGEWTFQLAAGEPLALETFLELPQNATLGPQPAAIDFEIVADRPYRFRVHRELRIGTGDITFEVFDRKLPDGRLEIEQVLVNRTSPLEILDFDCSLFVPGMKRQRRYVTKLGAGEDRRIYHLPDAEALRGHELWIRAREEFGRRVLNYRWRVGENWDETPAE